MRAQQWAEVLNWKQIDAGPMNRWLLPAAVVALLVVGWQHRGQGLARACFGIVGRAMPAQESVSNMGGAWEEKSDRTSGANPLQSLCRSLAQGN